MGLREYFDDYYFGHMRRRRARLAIVVTAIGLAASIVVLIVASKASDDEPAAQNGATVAVTEATTPAPAETDEPAASPDTSSPSTEATDAPETSAPEPATTDTEVAASEAPATTEPIETVPPPSDTVPATTASTAVEAAPYSTLPDGSPEPVVAIFDTTTVTLTGAVPSRAAADKLMVLAAANSKTPVYVIDQMEINPAVPINVGVRVIELNSVRFPSGGVEVLPDHALELDRVARVMDALPNVTVLVIGHADQLGDPEANYEVSAERARAVVNYLVSQGIDGDRLASRAVGDSDLLSINNDSASLALNRRTEFVFYGLLLD